MSSLKKRIKVHDKNNGKCWICNEVVHFNEMTIDHIIPVVKGGSGRLDNLMPAHKKCNSYKGSDLIDEIPLEKYVKILFK